LIHSQNKNVESFPQIGEIFGKTTNFFEGS